MKPKRLRILDIHTPKFWFTIFYEPYAYGEPWFRIDFWYPHSWARWWIKRPWQWEDIPDTHGMESEPILQKNQDTF